MNRYLLSFLLLVSMAASGQHQSLKVLFLGNSYTAVNNLPQMVADIAASTGDTLLFDSNTPGGYTFQLHCGNASSLGKIAAGSLNYVILQEQSELPSLQDSVVENQVFPYAEMLDSLVNAFNPCGETMFYMTWGRKNGDAAFCPVWPPVCTYAGMDSLLNLRYRMMALANGAVLSPVGAVWHYIRHNFPQIELYQSDESHPSVAGTYAAACSFYAALFREDPLLVTYDASLTASEAADIRQAAHVVVFDSLIYWHVGEYDPRAEFACTENNPCEVSFSNLSINYSNSYWDFGDGSTSCLGNPVHVFPSPGLYNVMLAAGKCGRQDTVVHSIPVSAGLTAPDTVADLLWSLRPNPAGSVVFLNVPSRKKLSYKIFGENGSLAGEGKLHGPGDQIDLSKLPCGIYFFHLSAERRSLGQRTIIKM